MANAFSERHLAGDVLCVFDRCCFVADLWICHVVGVIDSHQLCDVGFCRLSVIHEIATRPAEVAIIRAQRQE